MTRDYEAQGTGANSTLGLVLNFDTPEWKGIQAGVGYNYSEELWENHNTDMLLNDPIHILNEAWISYSHPSGTTLTAGRMINNGEVFRKDDYRQKARAIEAVQLQSKFFTLGHGLRLSNWIQAGDKWEFNSFDKVFGTEQNSGGVTWIETVINPHEQLEIALYDAYAWEISNLMGTRIKWSFDPNKSVTAYGRMEEGTGDSGDHNNLFYGLSYQQRVGSVNLEPGFISVHGDKMLFQEATTGLNHALGATMMMYCSLYGGGADTVYLKASTQIKNTALYALYLYTWQDETKADGQEINFVVKQSITDDFSIAFKGGVAYRESELTSNTTATDARIFLTYDF